MSADKKPIPPTAPPRPPGGKPKAKVPADNRLLLPDARWQRFQRYVWDKKKG
jgi:hypothetical protein